MVERKRAPVNQQSDPGITWRGTFSLEQREAMIREAAYYRYVNRGYTPGHALDDWLAAEAELERETPEPAESLPDLEVHQSGIHGAGKDDLLKQMIKQHPQKAIPQVESVEPEKAPHAE